MATFITNAAAIEANDAVTALIDVGSADVTGDIKIYDSSVPADADAALGGATLLAELDMTDPAFGAAGDDTPGAIATAASITDDSSADATGTATFFRVTNRDNLAVIQGSVTATGGGGDMELNTVSIVASAVVSISAFTFFTPES